MLILSPKPGTYYHEKDSRQCRHIGNSGFACLRTTREEGGRSLGGRGERKAEAGGGARQAVQTDDGTLAQRYGGAKNRPVVEYAYAERRQTLALRPQGVTPLLLELERQQSQKSPPMSAPAPVRAIVRTAIVNHRRRR